MLRYAREHSPESSFVQADARLLQFTPAFHGAISTFDSLNHILSAEELFDVFGNVHAHSCQKQRSFSISTSSRATLRRGKTRARVSMRTTPALFGAGMTRRRGSAAPNHSFGAEQMMHRSDLSFLQRFHPSDEVMHLLSRAGFSTTRVYRPIEDLGWKAVTVRGGQCSSPLHDKPFPRDVPLMNRTYAAILPFDNHRTWPFANHVHGFVA
jgi:hypothetical protein